MQIGPFSWLVACRVILDYDQAHLVVLCFADTVFSLQIGNPASSNSIDAILLTVFGDLRSHVSMSHFGNSYYISNFLIIFVMVICDL